MRLVGGKGDGMRIFSVRNGGGPEFTVSLDRCADISRLSLCGDKLNVTLSEKNSAVIVKLV